MSGDSTEGKYPEQAILYKQKGDWRAGEGREVELLPCGFILLVFGDRWKSSRKICKYA